MNSIRRCLLSLLFLSVIPGAFLLSGEHGIGSSSPSTSPRVFVLSISGSAQPSALQESTYCWVIRNFVVEGFVLSREPREHVVYVNAVERGGLVAMSFFFGEVIPDSIVQLCRNAEVFYANLSAEKREALPAEGKWVREMVTEDYVRQFIYPRDSRVLLVEKEGLQKGIEDVVGEFCRVHCRLAGK
jgi:hypothetical protein